jgi:TonB family protein
MIALWMLAATVAAALVGLAAAAAERVARVWRGPGRDVWSAALALAVALALTIPALPRTAPAPVPNAPSPRPVQMLAAVVVRADGVARGWADVLAALDTPLAVAWVVLSALVLAVVARGVLTLARARRTWRPRDVDGTTVLVAADVGPAVVGVRRPAIVLPEWTLALDAPLRALVVRHEAEHVRARDPAHLALGAFGVVAMPWNPALWWMLRRLRRALEIDCDARVLAAQGEARDVSRYGLLLLAVAQRRTVALRPLAGAPALAESTSDLSKRITAMRTSPPRRRVLHTVLGILGASAAVAGAIAACAAPRDVLGPRAAARPKLDTSTVRKLPTVVATAQAPATDDSVPAMVPSSDGATLRTGAVSAETYRRVRAAHDSAAAMPTRTPRPMKPTVVDGPYFEFQVEHPVIPAPGNMGPRYPDSLKVAGVEGVVLAQFVVDTNGYVLPGSFKVLKSDHDMFTRAVASALPNVRFIPAEVGGKKVRQVVQQPFQFSLSK